MSFILIVGGLIGILALVNAIAQFQSKRRNRLARPNPASLLKPQAKIIALPTNATKTARAKVEVMKIEEELV